MNTEGKENYMQTSISFQRAGDLLAKGDSMPFLAKLQEKTENELHITIFGAAVGEEDEGARGDPVLDQVLADCKPIIPDSSRRFDVVFEDYILYQVRNESYAAYDASAEGTGTYLMQFEKSRFLDYFLTVTDACRLEDGSFYPAPWKHYAIFTQNHVIDVIAQTEPKVLYPKGGL